MTAQAHDLFLYRDHSYTLVGISEERPPFDPAEAGISVVMHSTACYRGFIATFALDDERLVLKNLLANTLDKNAAPVPGRPLNGVTPAGPKEKYDFPSSYSDVNLPLAYTGGLLIGDGFIEELYVHMGFHPAWKFRTVHELLFKEGRLTGSKDVSRFLKEIRESASPERLQPGPHADRKEVETWIDRCFSMKYSL